MHLFNSFLEFRSNHKILFADFNECKKFILSSNDYILSSYNTIEPGGEIISEITDREGFHCLIKIK